MRIAIALVLPALMIGCAANPDRIDPAPVAVDVYLPQTCDQLASDKLRDQDVLATEEREQRSVRRSDTWGVLLVGMPVGRMAGGNREDQISQLKGELVAIDEARKVHNCT